MQRMFAAAFVLAACGDDAGPPTYHEDVEPLLRRHCVGCHSAGNIAPFALDSLEQARTHAASAAVMIAERLMPPFAMDNTGDCHTYRDARWLTDDEIARFQAWVEAGMPAGEPPAEPPQDAPADELTGDVLVVDPGAEYTPVDDGKGDDYRCFVVDAGVTADRFITAFEVVPGEPREVHHVLLFASLTPEADAEAAAMDAADATPGYPCYGTAGVTALPIAAWAPGVAVRRYPDGTGVRAFAGRKIILQVHYWVGGGAYPDRTTVRLEVRDDVVAEGLMFGALEREFTLPPREEEVMLEAELPLLLLRTLDIEAVDLRGVFPHMHTLGTNMRIDLVDFDGTTCLADAPRYDFDWQQFYFYEQSIPLVADQTVRLECHYDTRSVDAPVQSGISTDQEMCVMGMYGTVPGMPRLDWDRIIELIVQADIF